MPDDKDRISVFYGPVVLAGDLGPEDDPRVHEPFYVPVFVSDHRNPSEWMEPIEGEPNAFVTKNIGSPRDVELKPFYKTHEHRFSIFWDLFSPEEWKKEEVAYQKELERQNQLEEATIDYFQPGEMQPERDHDFEGDNTSPYRFRDRPGRISSGGWFTFDMEVDSKGQNNLVVDYWRGGYRRTRAFDIFIDDHKLVSENITSAVDTKFIPVEYEIPEHVTSGKEKVRVKFGAHDRAMAGPIFGVRIIKR